MDQTETQVLRTLAASTVPLDPTQLADIRVPALLAAPAAVRFLSCEPLLGPVDLRRWLCPGPGRCEQCHPPEYTCPRLGWVITGGESGPRYRPADMNWFRTIRDQCAAAGVAYFHKQHGGRTPKATGNVLDGQVWEQFPDEFPIGLFGQALVDDARAEMKAARA